MVDFVQWDIKLDTREIRGLLKASDAPKTRINEIMAEPAAAYFAGRSRDWLYTILSDGSKTRGVVIKATGKSARNIKVAKIPAIAMGGSAFMVYEGSDTVANQFIRTGTPKQGTPPVSTIKSYIQAKGLSYFRGLYVHAAASGATDPLEKVAWIVATSIKKRGTSAAHKQLYPGGQKRFDYASYAVNQLKMLKKIYSEFRTSEMPKSWKMLMAYYRTASFRRPTNDVLRVRRRV